MIEITKTDVYGFEAAIRGMRNPMNSWHKSDTINGEYYGKDENGKEIIVKYDVPQIGLRDLDLIKHLVNAGSDHRKFMRMITVSADILAPLYWWKEYDTYKIGTVANSCSTMHKIHEKPFTLDDFSHEHLTPLALSTLDRVVDMLNNYREDFSLTKMKEDWWQMIQLLPSSYNQLRTVQLNYEVLYSIYFARKDHKLDEWHTFCDWIKNLPYMRHFLEA